MHSNLDDPDRAEVRRHLAAILRATPIQDVDPEDEEHKPLIERTPTPETADAPQRFERVCMLVSDFLDESGLVDTEFGARLGAKLQASAPASPEMGEAGDRKLSVPVEPLPSQRPRTARSSLPETRVVYATRKARDEELDGLFRFVQRSSGASAHAAALIGAINRLETLAAIVIERIDNSGKAQPVAVTTLHRNGADGQFLVTPVCTAFPLTPDIYACGASHLVQITVEEAAIRCTMGQLSFVAAARASVYKSIVQSAARCRFRSFDDPGLALDVEDHWLDEFRPGLKRRIGISKGGATSNLCLLLDAYGQQLLPRHGDHLFDVAVSHIIGVAEPRSNARLRRLFDHAMRGMFRLLSIVGDRPIAHETSPEQTSPSKFDLVHRALSDDPNRRVFAGGDGTKVLWSFGANRIAAPAADPAQSVDARP